MRDWRGGRGREHIPASVLAEEWEQAGLSLTALLSWGDICSKAWPLCRGACSPAGASEGPGSWKGVLTGNRGQAACAGEIRAVALRSKVWDWPGGQEGEDGGSRWSMLLGGGKWKEGAQSTTGITLPMGGGRSLQGSVSPRLDVSPVFPGGRHLTLAL